MAGLSKSRLMSFRQCPRKLWLEKHRPELAEISTAQQAIFDTGHAVGAIARRLYDPAGSGRLIDGARGMSAALRETRAALQDGSTAPIFEATFERDGLLVRTDVIERDPARLVEVKSATNVKPEYLADCAIQAWVLETSPVTPRSVAVAHVDRDFVYRGGGDYAGLLAEADVSEEIRPLMKEVPVWLDEAQRVLGLDEPEVRIGQRCNQPYECAFKSNCWPKTDYPLDGLPGVGRHLDEMIVKGFKDIRDLPQNLVPKGEGLRVWRAIRNGVAEITGKARAELAALPWPRYYLDFETIGAAIPLWAGLRPYQAVAFQFSLHIERAPGQLEQVAFVDLSGELPARKVARALIDAIGTQGPVLTYTSYEKQCLTTLASLCPDLADCIEAILARLVDLHPIAKRGYYHPAMQGSWSIKALLPTIAPDMDYASLEGVHEGSGAQAAYLEAINPDTRAARKAELESQLLRYCAHDTLGMVRVVEFLSAG